MDKRNTGVYEKYIVRRTDNKDAPGCKHESCQYFVLDLTHDKFALPALSAYAEACSLEYPILSAELIEFVSARQNKGSAEQQPITQVKSSAVATAEQIAAIADKLEKLNYYGADYHKREINSVVVYLRQLLLT